MALELVRGRGSLIGHFRRPRGLYYYLTLQFDVSSRTCEELCITDFHGTV